MQKGERCPFALFFISLPLSKGVSFLVFERTYKDHNKVDQATDTEDTKGNQPDDSSAGFPYIKPVNTQPAQKEA